MAAQDVLIDGARGHLEPGEELLAACLANPRGWGQMMASGANIVAREIAARKQRKSRAAAEAAGLTVDAPMAAALTSRRLLTFKVEQNKLGKVSGVGDLLGELESSGDLGDADGDRAVNVREARRSYNRATKLPRRLVEELSRTTTLAQKVWIKAREDAEFPVFLPWLEKMIGLKREEAQAIGFGDGVRDPSDCPVRRDTSTGPASGHQ